MRGLTICKDKSEVAIRFVQTGDADDSGNVARIVRPITRWRALRFDVLVEFVWSLGPGRRKRPAAGEGFSSV